MNMRTLTFLISGVLLTACQPLQSERPDFVSRPLAAQPAELDRGLVSAADPRAAEAGARMLRMGGSATDAAIATMLALTVVEPQSSGIGGGGFFVHAAPDGTVTTIDGRETAPSAAEPDWFLDEGGKPLGFREAVISGLSVGVPGNLRLAEMAHRQYGRLPWETLVQPAFELARDGFEISPRFHEFLVRSPDRSAFDAYGKELFYDAAGEPRPAGARIQNPRLAATLLKLSAEGPDSFYEGSFAANLAAHVAEATPRPSGMSAEDVTTYTAKPREPVCGMYRVYRVCGMGPPSSGATTVLAILKQLEPFDLAASGPGSATTWHLFAESQRLAYADRERYLADADFVPVPVGWLVDADYLATRAALISPSSTMAAVEAGIAPQSALAPPDGNEPPESGTSHFVAVDSAGNAVSYTSTIEGSFGSGLMFGGFYLNNELTDFSFTPSEDGRVVANRVEGGKRPRSSMAPTVVYGPDGRLMYIVGAAGGGTIPVQIAKTLIGLIDFNLSVDQALALPQLYSPGDVVVIEEGSALEAMVDELKALGHAQVTARSLPLKANAAQWTPEGWIGAADPRSEGVSIRQ
ncbi:gamma-glutamyltransferase [Allopontixanthobacter sediminis]|uniref:Glutathione hydrolase proenzyme n=1 Tax=Allopontixanthobacter sediminis TaxID=1689985 RepID=A0A845B249_9SPHN|nr:gamma-glutamyltransferase [Allopontixanthobacter sediminis]MXP44500.1 gamma-glutamyltransferase [Allopontixanthobacter sediminis]